ncbi:hypothetical protein MPG36_07110 [Helicobacter pylori]|uniref:hypothetical protein n=1 Tax=Helicobacter pylori TaxID=210 RepID=UPI001FD4D421|nr:hypothetical protein [Helicobacter pylori]UOR80474.1 hypothetical protein MPG36_07110 [Helicobacter pylori]
MRKGGLGSANTQTGIKFEEENDLVSRLKDTKGYRCEERSLGGYEIYFEDKFVAYSFKKHELYEYLKKEGIDWKKSYLANFCLIMLFLCLVITHFYFRNQISRNGWFSR